MLPLHSLRHSRRLLAVLAASFLVVLSNAHAQAFSKLNVKGRVQVEIPEDWVINDAEQRKKVRDTAMELMGTNTAHIAALSAASFPVPSRAFVRISFIPLPSPITQEDVRQEVKADRQQVLRDLADMWKESSPAMWTGLAKRGIKEVGAPTFAVEPLGGQTALVIRYARTSATDSNEAMSVAQYHVPLGAEKAIVTLSNIQGDRAAKAVVDRVRSTLQIK